jgi:hypothetical protein
MGSLGFFDEDLPDMYSRSGEQRTVEVYTHGGKLYVRIGRLTDEGEGNGYGVALDERTRSAIANALDRAGQFLSWPDIEMEQRSSP